MLDGCSLRALAASPSTLAPELSQRPKGLHETLASPSAAARSVQRSRPSASSPSTEFGGSGSRRKAGKASLYRRGCGFYWLLLALLGMAMLSLIIFVCLCLGGAVPFEDASPAHVRAANEGIAVTHGSVIKLMHDKTRFRLHSHDVPYGSGSGQQSVTSFPTVEDSNSFWIAHLVRPTGSPDAFQGEPIPKGSTIRLQHSRTRKWLHSHLHQSPISGNLEVSCFGGDDQSDSGDFWRLEIEGKGDVWMKDQKVRLYHLDTSGYLHSHDKKYNRIVAGQQEVCGVTKKSPFNLWVAAEGVYFPQIQSS